MLGNDDSILKRRKTEAELDQDIREREAAADSPLRSDAGDGSILERKVGRTVPRETPVEPVRLAAHDPTLDDRLRREARTGAPSSILEPRRRSILGGRRTRAVEEERYREEVAAPRRRSSFASRFLWSVVLLVALVVVCIAAYGYCAVAAYRGQLNVLPSLQARLAADGQRIAAAGQAMQNQQATWSQRFQTAGAALAGKTPTQAELDQRAAALQGQINTLQSAQQSADQRLNQLQGQMDQLRAQPPAPVAAAPTVPPAPQRVDFEAGVHHATEVSPGIRLNVSRIDSNRQRFDGSLILADGRTLPIRNRGLAEPVKFLNTGNPAPDALVVTQVTKDKVIGYMELAPAATSSMALPATSPAGVSPSR